MATKPGAGASSSPSSTVVSDHIASVLRVIEDVIRQFCQLINEKGISAILKTALLFVALFALRENLKHMFGYQCPEENYYFYGNLYIYGPAVFFICFAFVFSRPFWEFATGCCRSSCNKRLLSSPRSAIDIWLGVSAPFLWVACAFTEEDYYICALYGPLGGEIQEKVVQEDARWINRAESQCHVIAWAIIMSWAVVSALVVSLHRCCTKSQGVSVTV